MRKLSGSTPTKNLDYFEKSSLIFLFAFKTGKDFFILRSREHPSIIMQLIQVVKLARFVAPDIILDPVSIIC